MKKTLLIFAAASMLFAACGGGSNETKTEETAPAATESTEAPEATGDAVITISAGDDMKFDLSEIKVKEGQNVKLTLKHTGQAPVASMGHNFILLAAGVDLDAFAQDALNAKDSEYIPTQRANEIIAHTKLIGGGETTEIEFKAPAKGTYDFLCSFPGHYAMMKGEFIVE